MNILIPDSWLREYLETEATHKDIQRCVSLCGPSVERIHTEEGEYIYDVEITTNRPDSMSISGFARECAAILPRFGFKSTLIQDPYLIESKKLIQKWSSMHEKSVNIKTDHSLNPRWTSIIISNVTVGPSPDWLQKKLSHTGIRSLNTVIDVTNLLMREFGQPAHAFDLDAILPNSSGIPFMELRAAKKDEKVTTLDGVNRTLTGGDIVIEDGSGRLIDLCGIMGALNSSIKSHTKNVLLFMQTYDPVQIRKTSMSLSHHTEAGSLFEKGLDPELVLPTVIRGVERITELTGGHIASPLYDMYPKPYTQTTVSVSKDKVNHYIGCTLTDAELSQTLIPLGLPPTITKSTISVAVPSFRRDVVIDVDIIEEIARIYGYHEIKTRLPDSEPPVTMPNPELQLEEDIKIRLRDYGYTETFTYSMISAELMNIFSLPLDQAYEIANPLSSDWTYMRPSLVPSVISTLRDNLSYQSTLHLFELSMIYDYQVHDLPIEQPTLVVVTTGNTFRELKGLAETILELGGITPNQYNKTKNHQKTDWYTAVQCAFGDYGSMGVLRREIAEKLKISVPVTILDLSIHAIIRDGKPIKQYRPIAKYPPSFEDLSLIVPEKILIGDVMYEMKSLDPLITDIILLDSYENSRTLHITYQSNEKTLSADDIRPIREKILSHLQMSHSIYLKK